MDASAYQRFKLVVVGILGTSKDAIHIYVGVFALFLTILPSRKEPLSLRLLGPGFVLSVFMEILDMRDDWNLLGRVRPVASIHDLLNTNLIPVLIYVFLKKYFVAREGPREGP